MGAARRTADCLESEVIRLTAELDRLISLSIARCTIQDRNDPRGRETFYSALGRSFPSYDDAKRYITDRIKWEQP